MLSQLILTSFINVDERSALNATLLLQTVGAFALQMLNIGSAAVFFLSGLPLFLVLVGNRMITRSGKISLWTYSLGQAFPLLGGTMLLLPVLEFFVPLVRRSFFLLGLEKSHICL